MSNYKILLFDMDGTIAETDGMIIHSLWELYDLYNPSNKKSEEEIIYFSGPPIAETLKREFPNMDQDFIVNEFLERCTKYYDLYTSTFEYEIEVLSLLKEKGYKMAVVTNKGHEKAEYVLRLLHLEEYFDFVIGNGDVNKLKPDPEGILEAIHRFGGNKEETLYIGDNDIDYITATNAGVDALICAWGPRKLNVLDKCKYVARSYLDIKEILG